MGFESELFAEVENFKSCSMLQKKSKSQDWKNKMTATEMSLMELVKTAKAMIFDIETGPLPAELLSQIYESPSEDDIPYGNRTKLDTRMSFRAEYLEEHKQKFFERAALSAETGRVLCIGLGIITESNETHVLHHEEESEILREFWQLVSKCISREIPMVGWNSHRFDIPFLTTRSWINRVPVPPIRSGQRRYLNDNFVDAMKVFVNFEDKFCGLNRAAKLFGIGEKTGNGSNFHELWDWDREKAIEYVVTDIQLTSKIASRIGIF